MIIVITAGRVTQELVERVLTLLVFVVILLTVRDWLLPFRRIDVTL